MNVLLNIIGIYICLIKKYWYTNSENLNNTYFVTFKNVLSWLNTGLKSEELIFT